MLHHEKPLQWVGSSHKDLMALPADVRRLFGFALSLAQAGDRHDGGIATPKEDMDIIRARLKLAEAFAKELRK